MRVQKREAFAPGRFRCIGRIHGAFFAQEALAGAGISLCAPILISLAGRGASGGVRASAVSVGTTTAYLGFVVGPAAGGLLAPATTLPGALAAGQNPAGSASARGRPAFPQARPTRLTGAGTGPRPSAQPTARSRRRPGASPPRGPGR